MAFIQAELNGKLTTVKPLLFFGHLQDGETFIEVEELIEWLGENKVELIFFTNREDKLL